MCSFQEMRCSIYKNAFDRYGATTDVMRVLEAIESGRWKDEVQAVRKAKSDEEKDQAKRNLPGVTFTGRFSYRKDSCLENYTGIIVIDIDEGSGLELTKMALSRERYCLSVFWSPSGKGLKVLIPSDAQAKDHREAYAQVMQWFKDMYRVPVDEKNKNESRLCFVSHDKDIVINDAPDIFPVEPAPQKKKKWKGKSKTVNGSDAKAICKKMAEKREPHSEGNRNNHIHLLSCHMNRAAVPEEEALSFALSISDLSDKEIERTVRGVYERNSDEFGSFPVGQKQGGLWS